MIPALAVLLALSLGASNPLDRGERSYSLPETIQTVLSAPPLHSAPLWSHPVDRPPDGDMLAIGDGVVAVASDGRICAYDDVSGARVWCAGSGRGPVYASGTMAYLGDDGRLYAVDARSGRPQWHQDGVSAVWSAGGTFLTAALPDVDPKTNAATQLFADRDTAGNVLWTTRLPAANGANARMLPPYLVLSWVYGGATLSFEQGLLRLGAGGGLYARVGGNALEIRPPNVIVDTRDNEIGEEVEDHFLTFELTLASIPTGAATATYHYAPDYGANYDAWAHNCCAGQSSGNGTFVDADFVYCIINRNVYRYRFAPGEGQHPLRVSTGNAVAGGPYRGTVYVVRPNGLWALHPLDDSIRAQPVAGSTAAFAGLTIAHDTGYAAFGDGSVHGFDLASGRPTLDAHPCSGGSVRVSETVKRVYVACASNVAWSLTAYAR